MRVRAGLAVNRAGMRFFCRVENHMKKCWMCVSVGVLVLAVPGRSWAQSDPTTRCKYAEDNPPSQIGPGLQQDADYNFAYVSDYEGNARTYRRRICSDSKARVRFDWKLTGLK